ncbi:MAG: restriction endonuclease subunit S, partial [Bacteroidia bacterium]|nr:restriction endonuclease subunit S [Bacteroidia bacterium]
MSEWKTYKLGDLIDVKHGFAFKGEFFSDEPTEDILLTPGNFKIGGGFKTDKFKYYKGDYPKSYVLKEGDILITMTDLSKAGDTLGYSAKIPKHTGINYLHNQRLGLVQFKSDNIDPDFLYWVLRTKPYQYYIVGSATGSTVKHTSPTRICSYEFQAPKDKGEQQQIAQILTLLDDKIELNLQMNQTLEAMAQAIFKEWFVNFNFPGFDGELV